jgi:hypothetical protein
MYKPSPIKAVVLNIVESYQKQVIEADDKGLRPTGTDFRRLARDLSFVPNVLQEVCVLGWSPRIVTQQIKGGEFHIG